MPIDASIYSLVKPPVQGPGPLEQFGQVENLRSLMGQRRLHDLQTQKLEGDLAEETAGRDYLKNLAPGVSPTSDESVTGLMRIAPTKALAMQKAGLDVAKTRGEIDKTGLEVAVKATAMHRDALADVNDPQAAAQWVQAGYSDPRLAPILSKGGTVEQALARIPTDPTAFNEWKQKNALGATKFIEMNKPHITTQDTGGASNIVATPGLGGAPTVLSSTPMTLKPGETERIKLEGARLAEERRHHGVTETQAAEQVKQGSSQIVTDQDGNTMLVDKKTGVGKPVVGTDGAPVKKADKPLTESQGKAAGMLHRATAANDILNTLEDAGSMNRGIIKQGAEKVPLVGEGLAMGVNMLPTSLGGPSEAQQKVEQARRDFVNAALRVESGAAISQSEFQNAEKQYFPMPGDSKGVLEQKRKNRQTELEGLKLQAGPSKIAQSIRPAAAETPKADKVDVSKLSDSDLKKALGL